ncbi:uncharacterized protein G2W53_014645 [Senna tora]|uniref:Uncharacterized protein n=1 Tax=Senna tora TaxID=362788 RepID=A0A834WTX7_9FABA|nr:uncharacterized protein G2W53_014645 [Senna tora]
MEIGESVGMSMTGVGVAASISGEAGVICDSGKVQRNLLPVRIFFSKREERAAPEANYDQRLLLDMGYTKEGNEWAFINDALVSISGSFKASINDAHSTFSLYWIVVITCRHHQNNSSMNAINLSFKNIILIFRLS